MECPLCRVYFSSRTIERHAATCTGVVEVEVEVTRAASRTLDDASLPSTTRTMLARPLSPRRLDVSDSVAVDARSSGVSFSGSRVTDNPSRVEPPPLHSTVFTLHPRPRRGVVTHIGDYEQWPSAALTVKWDDGATSVARWGVPRDQSASPPPSKGRCRCP